MDGTPPRYSPSQIGAFVLTKMPLGPDGDQQTMRMAEGRLVEDSLNREECGSSQEGDC